MPRPELLNNVDHKDLRIVTRAGAQYGDAVMSAVTFASEFRAIQAHYPIVFGKAADGSFQPLALFGFDEGENLFLEGDRWDAPYKPLMIERLPFLIGTNGPELMVHVDMDSPRIGGADGEAVFQPHGGNTEYIERVNSMLYAIHQGLQSTPAFVEALLKHELLESFVLDIELNSGAQGRLVGFYTINEERLMALGDETVAALHKAGYLQAIYMVLASLSQFRSLIDRKNRRDA